MRIGSFRLRIALLAVMLSGAVLLLFGGWTWAVIQRMNLQRIDDNIRELGQRHLARAPQGPEHWQQVGESLQFLMGDDEEDAFILLVKGRRDETVYCSTNWPDDLPSDALPPPGEFETALAPPRPHGPLGGRGIPRALGPDEPPPGAPEGFMPADAEGEAPSLRTGPGMQYRGGRGEGRRGGQRGLGRAGLGPPLREPVFITRNAGGRQWRIGVLGTPGVTFVLGFNMERFNAETLQIRNAFLVALPVALALIALAGWWISQRALHPINVLTRTAEGVTAKGLDQRIPSKDIDAEFRRLITVFNAMMDRLERSFHQATRFSADAAHELKTPLTILQGELEQALQEASPGSSRQQTLTGLLDEVLRLKAIIRKLLLLSLADSGQLKLTLKPLNLTEAVEAVCEDMQILAPQLNVEQSLAPDQWVMADADLLNQVLQNLVSNAIKYNHDGGKVKLALRGDGKAVEFLIGNTGQPIADADRERVFERFFRGEKSRTRSVDGVGLGLNLAREIVRAHQGELRLRPPSKSMSVFSMTLPAVAPGDA